MTGMKLGSLNGGLEQQADVGHVPRRQLGILQPLDGPRGVLPEMHSSFAGPGLARGDADLAQLLPNQLPGRSRFTLSRFLRIVVHENYLRFTYPTQLQVYVSRPVTDLSFRARFMLRARNDKSLRGRES